MFFGTYTPRLDDKGRLFLPAKFRDRLTEGLVLTKGQDRCIYVWPQASFAEFSDRISKTPFTNKATRDFVRVLFSGASDEVPDKQGRITVPAPLREYARLDRDCVVVGAMERVEIWDATRWSEYSDAQEESFATLSEEVIEGLL
ncbi:division/cell wall cluster transcriptional repressor MraZ [Mumia zhuanghuii]|uniref:Transcriptional regulator MraZ n=2 Tax=Mumia TaxID=1546255 RepID=A0ABW1QIB0_9ACTN|nr:MULTISPECIES: division/cell wall cluster transcriptional repressor MraZ [Mumia]KAA1423481.1 division/cell wall cluster transcriptional repressor MraZ [Mumia zhuanghuii]